MPALSLCRGLSDYGLYGPQRRIPAREEKGSPVRPICSWTAQIVLTPLYSPYTHTLCVCEREREPGHHHRMRQVEPAGPYGRRGDETLTATCCTRYHSWALSQWWSGPSACYLSLQVGGPASWPITIRLQQIRSGSDHIGCTRTYSPPLLRRQRSAVRTCSRRPWCTPYAYTRSMLGVRSLYTQRGRERGTHSTGTAASRHSQTSRSACLRAHDESSSRVAVGRL